jgi:hypothetical protein
MFDLFVRTNWPNLVPTRYLCGRISKILEDRLAENGDFRIEPLSAYAGGLVGGVILERLNKQSVPFPHDLTELSSHKLL